MVGGPHLVWKVREGFPREVMLSWGGRKERREPGEGETGRTILAEAGSHAKALR